MQVGDYFFCLFVLAISYASDFKMSPWHRAVVCQSVWSGAVFQQGRGVEALSLPSLEFRLSPHFSLTLWPTHRLPGLLISHSSQRGQRASASWETELREGELPRQVKRSRKDILLICCWDPETDQRLWQVSSAAHHIILPPTTTTSPRELYPARG